MNAPNPEPPRLPEQDELTADEHAALCRLAATAESVTEQLLAGAMLKLLRRVIYLERQVYQ